MSPRLRRELGRSARRPGPPGLKGSAVSPHIEVGINRGRPAEPRWSPRGARAPPGKRVAIGYVVYGIPELFVIGRDGRITYKHIGAVGEPTLVRKMEEGRQGMVSPRQGRDRSYQPVR